MNLVLKRVKIWPFLRHISWTLLRYWKHKHVFTPFLPDMRLCHCHADTKPYVVDWSTAKVLNFKWCDWGTITRERQHAVRNSILCNAARKHYQGGRKQFRTPNDVIGGQAWNREGQHALEETAIKLYQDERKQRAFAHQNSQRTCQECTLLSHLWRANSQSLSL